MKLKYNIITLLLLSAGVQSCDLMGSIDKIQPEYVLEDGSGTVIIDEATANMALNGLYDCMRNSDVANMRRALGGLSGVIGGVQQVSNSNEFVSGNITEKNLTVEKAYRGYYRVVNEANSFLNNLELSGVTEKELPVETKEGMIAEVRCLRGLFNFHLLRLFGQYQDMDSKYGIVLNDKPITSNEPKARTTVQKTYDSIIEDLDYAIEHGSHGEEHWRASALFAKAIKSRVLLTVGKYAESAQVAGEVIVEAEADGYALENDYMGVFTNQFNSSEVLFAPYVDANTTPQQLFASCAVDYFQPGNILTSISLGMPGKKDLRYAAEYERVNGHGNNKYLYSGYPDVNTYYFMRLAEVYYIKAEAEARLQDYDAAGSALAEVIARAGYDEGYVNGIPDARMLEIILKHKMLDLNAENGEEWFDMVRYHRNGDFASWSEEEQGYLPTFHFCIFPIPRTVRAGNALLEQTPEFN